MVEQWRSVVGFEQYQVSDLGRIKNVCSGHILAGARTRYGYLQVRLRAKEGKIKNLLVHRLVAAAFHGLPGPGQVCNHLSGVKTDNRAVNLEWCSRAQNNSHAARLGLSRGPLGERNPNAKLRAEDVVEMRHLSSAGVGYSELGRRFGVSPSTALNAVIGRTWGHVTALAA